MIKIALRRIHASAGEPRLPCDNRLIGKSVVSRRPTMLVRSRNRRSARRIRPRWRKFGHFLKCLGVRLTKFLLERERERYVTELDDHQLRDIGIDPSSIQRRKSDVRARIDWW